MRLENKMHPRRQAKRCTHKSNYRVSQNDSALGGVILVGLVLFCTLVAPRLMYMYLAPLKGWC